MYGNSVHYKLKALTRQSCGLKGACWQSAYFERVLRSDQDRRSIARYIVVNPLRAKLVELIRQNPYWNTVYL